LGVPEISLTDPELLTTMPAELTAHTGLDALSHAIAHQIGGALDLPHGLLNAILMPHVMRFNAETHAARYVDVARALGVAVADLTPAAAADAAIDRVEALARALDIPAGLRALGVDQSDFPRFAVNALRDAYITTNPRPVTENDVRGICVAAY
jgi:alcohol dehydrogenase